jgi:endonuclease/exonuclease/phosphatase family metal-dependent hydrolase
VRLVVYNIRYATGFGPAFHLPLPGAGYLRTNRRVLAGITEFLRRQDADVIAAPRVHGERFHYFDSGIKRLIIELELEEVSLFLVHLSLKYRHRQYQLRYLHELVEKSQKPVIVAGDFNTFWGTHELYLFKRAARLRSANLKNLATYPSNAPRAELDFVLVDERIEITEFSVPDIRLSDHRPLVCDFHVRKE